jgi:subtilisin family serine protease
VSTTPPVVAIAACLSLVLPAEPQGQSFKVKQQCPPCAAVASSQGGADDVAPGALADRQWALKKNGINLESMPDGISSILGSGSTIVQIDTGVVKHPLVPRIESSADEFGLDVSASDGLFGPGQTSLDPLLTGFLRFPGHGTKTSSVILARPNGPFEGVTGAARGARVIPVRATQGVVLFPQRIGALEAEAPRIARALNEAARGERGLFRRRVDVVSMSLGGFPATKDLCPAVKAATDAGIIVIAAAGNQVRRTKYPARCPTAIAIAGSTYGEEPWAGSAGSAEVAVAAPAEGVWTASISAGIPCVDASSGTSFATALVAAMAAEWVRMRRAADPSGIIRSEDFRSALHSSARPWTGPKASEWSSKFGAGIADLSRLTRPQP